MKTEPTSAPRGAKHPPYSARIIKGGALLGEMRRLVLEWDGTPGCGERLVRANLLSHGSRMRAHDVVFEVFVPRYVRSRPPDIWKGVAILERVGWSVETLLPIHLFAAASADPLLWDFAVAVHEHGAGDPEVGIEDAIRFLARASADRFPHGRWSEPVRRRVAQGLLSALRDFGVLTGAVRKRLAPAYLPVESFAFLALLRHAVGIRGRDLLSDPAWQLFQLGENAVERQFIEAHQRRLLGYHAAGSVVRVEFPGETPEAYARALAQGTD